MESLIDVSTFVPRSTPFDGLYGEAPPERSTSFRLQAYERVANSLVEVLERVAKSVSTIRKANKGCQTYFVAME